MVLRVVVGLVFASQLGAAEVGTYFLAVAISSLAALIAMGGLDRLALAEVGREPAAVRLIANKLGRYVLALSFGMTAIGIAVLTTTSSRSGLPTETIVIAGLAIVPLNMTRLIAHVFRGRQRVTSSVAIGELTAPFLRLAVFAFLPMDMNANRAAVAYLVGWAVAAVVAIVTMRSVYPAAGPAYDWAMANLWQQARPLFLFSLASQVQTTFATGLAWLVGVPAEVGALGTADRMEQMSLLPTTATRFATAPKLVSNGDLMKNETRGLATRTARKSMVLQIPALVAVFVFAPTLLAALGSDFEAATGYVRILLVGGLVNAMTGSTTQALLMSDQRHRLATSSMVAVLVLFVVSLALAPFMGVTGVVVALATARSATGIVEWWLVRSSLGARVDVLATTSRVVR